MDTKLLKQKILDLAIHGKLVPQNPNDEPASKLLEKIREEKQKLIAEKKIKADKNDSYIFVGDDNRHYEKFADGTMKDIEDEIPFDVPKGWEWCRLRSIVSELGDGLHGTPEYSIDGTCFFVNGNNLLNGKLVLKADTKTVADTEYEKYKKNLNSKTVFVSINGTLGNIAFYNDEYIILGKSACYFNLILENFKAYIFILLNSGYFQKYLKNVATGSTIKNVSLQSMNDFLVPLPSYKEQEKITNEVNKICEIIDSLEKEKSDLQTAIKQAKSKILDLAIHGKLVPQDSSDEPASVLLEKLRAEKEAKIKAGELKRDKNDSYIYKSTTDNCYYEKFNGKEAVCIDEEIPFDIPGNWQWCRLPSICGIPITDGTHQTPTYSDKENGIPFLSSKDVTSQKIDWSRIKYITKELHEELQKRIKPLRNDILLAKNGTTGVAALVETDTVFDIYVTLAVLRPTNIVFPKFLLFMVNSPFCKDQFNGHLTGIGVPNLHLNDICKTFIPLPPISEQKRIVSKIEEMFERLDQIQCNLI